MLKRKFICALLLVAMLLGVPAGALAAKKASIKFPAKVGLMLEGGTVTLSPKLSNVKQADLAWSSSDESVLQVTDGTVQGVKAGKAALTVTGGGATAKCGVVVLPARLSIAAGEKASLPYGGVEQYKMKNTGVASVSKKGVVTGKKAGETKLTVKYGKQSVSLAVTVTAAEADGESAAAKLDCASETDQIVLVEHTKGYKAKLTVHEKQDGVWKQLFECTALVGKNGLGKTREGDRRTPTGTFNLTTPFGIKADPGANMPYTKVTKYHYWCATSGDKYYNQLVDTRVVNRKRGKADEYLIKCKGYYDYCLFIDYNAAGEAGKGSCIFLHCQGSKKYTEGCIAIPSASMKKIIKWARSGAKIVIREA